ncbi:MAG: hypothetical protein Q9210_005951 [Variospora velana]
MAAGIEILIRGTREFASITDLKRFLAHLLGPFEIPSFEVRICKARNHAILTAHKDHEGFEFVRYYLHYNVSPSLLFQGDRLTIEFGKGKPNEFLVRVLQREEKLRLLEEYERMSELETAKPFTSTPPSQREIRISSLDCGNWDFVALEPHCHPYYYEVSMDATATFGDRYLFLRYTIKAENDSLEMITYPSPDDTGSDKHSRRLQFLFLREGNGDLGIPNNAFQQLQDAAIEKLRSSVSSVENAAALLEKHDVGLATQTTWLVRKIHSLGFALSDDVFFRDLLDAVVFIQLQELKYKTRIPVKDGATLYGILDDTETLAEGEVYCSWIDKEGHVNCASGIVVVTRSPALHPSDIQTAKAIVVPQDSPLNWLHNCIVFSSRGARDLPSNPVRQVQLAINCRINGRYRPDFMAPGRKVKIEKHGIIFESFQPDDLEDGDPRRVGEPRRYRYYESKKILGILYRSVDERSAVLKDDSRLTQGVLAEVWEYWEDYVEEVVIMREAYDAMVLDIILQYSTHPTERLEEIEVFIGSVICRTGSPSKQQKEYMIGMKEKYDREVLSLTATMRNEEARGVEHEALLRSMACLYVGIEEAAERKESVEGVRKDTFGWIAAAACLKELEEYQEKRDVGPLKHLLGKLKVFGGR